MKGFNYPHVKCTTLDQDVSEAAIIFSSLIRRVYIKRSDRRDQDGGVHITTILVAFVKVLTYLQNLKLSYT